MKPFIQSILDTDLYKFSTSNVYFQLYPLAEGTFKFADRNKENWLDNPQFIYMIKDAFEALSTLALTDDEAEWCKNKISYIPANYWEWLKTFRFNPDKIEFWLDENGVFQCEVTDYMYKVTLYEIAVLATYAEVRNIVNGMTDKLDMQMVRNIIMAKLLFANEFKIPFAEFGTRRRFSGAVQSEIISVINKYSTTCSGTSNVYYSYLNDTVPSGTFPHEWVMFHAATYGYKRANHLSLEDWISVYDGNLGTALVDTYTTKSFLRTLSRKQAHLLTGFRQDSGDEFEVGDMIIERLKEFNIDPKTKIIVFSNALDFNKAQKIYEYFKDKCKPAFGIGTNLTCDVGIKSLKPANIVMKLSKCRLSDKDPWEKCLKISDDAGKHMGDDKEYDVACYELHLND